MGQKLQDRIKIWKSLLLDLGKSNKLINFIEGKRNNVKITEPSLDKLWENVVVNEREIVFPYAENVGFDENEEEKYDNTIRGDIDTTKSVKDLQKTLKALRYRANTSIEEQGINTLYLTYGMLKWRETDESTQTLLSPIILVPVKLLVESIASPYRIVLHEDEIVVNPTLSHKLNNDFGIIMPEFDSSHDSPEEYFKKLYEIIKNKGWDIERSTHLTNLSFLKINMYKDLERNEDKLSSNSVIATLVGEQNPCHISDELTNYNHDKQIRPIDSFQVVDADSSQQDAILLSKKGVSFVLQGPPGTGKSQTITNIIAEAIAEGKKVLFVSEKLAALQVVYNRLASVKLADFCFTLHSHKVKKKEILQDIANSINIDRTRVREEALTQLDLLERQRNLLNEYQEELHTPTSGLNITIYEVNGELAKLDNAPDVIFHIPKPDTETLATVNNKKYLLSELSKTIGRRSEDFADNVWRNSSIRILTYELRHEIDSKITTALPLLQNLDKEHSSICSQLSIDIKPSLIGNRELETILSVAGKSPIIPVEWVTKSDIKSLKDSAQNYKERISVYVNLKKVLSLRYFDAFFDIEAIKSKELLSGLMRNIQAKLNEADNYDSIVQNIGKTVEEIKIIEQNINSYCENVIHIAKKLGVIDLDTINQILEFGKFIEVLAIIYKLKPTKNWFIEEELNRIKIEFDADVALHNKILESRENVLSSFDKEIFNLDFYPILQRFRSEYRTIFRVFKSQYRNDKSQLKSYLSNEESLSYRKALEILKHLKNVSDGQNIIAEEASHYEENYGKNYVGINTQWNELRIGLEKFEQLMRQYQSIPLHIKNMILNDELPVSDINQFNKSFSIRNVQLDLNQLLSKIKGGFNQHSNWADIICFSQEICSIGTQFNSMYQNILDLSKENNTYESVINDLEQLSVLKELEEELITKKETICNIYGNYYNDVKTNWEELIAAIEYADDFSIIVEQYDLPEHFVKEICTNTEAISYCQSKIELISERRKALQEILEWFSSLFNDVDINQYYISDLANWMSECRDKKYLLEQWVDYCSNKERCEEAGLGEFIEKVEELNLNPNYIVDAYLKRFYHLWLDAVLPNFPAVQNFRGRIQQQTINKFCELDRGQFKIAQARVRERAISRIPDFNSINGARDEIAILKRELNKQRRIMPLRKLFKAIPNLITSLRPCFMMSPLSVSVFLEAQSYNFDLVIFDEASQVHTEDAIGAIMRGKQVIIVGDTKQLPPTSFFSTSLNDEEFDVDSNEENEGNDAGAYESILDEAVVVLPERSLRWHYRSRHEHLIAFSNIKIYNNLLITFPSSIENAPDTGVEYVYVKDGVYDRGGKKNNIAEAKKIADLVFEHFKNHPKRSLGVVTFSEAQQNAIDAAIRQRRLQNPRFDKFFAEDKDAPFFIKNLENVQGDERDTIIFSIGYAKDSKGIMYMNFGPLSREGGYRRLNVAITRAKYNVKLVGSIVPADIDLDKVNSEGVKMLRSYIEFAQRGIIALENELKFNHDLNFDSPFEEAIYDFLQSKGYNVVTQVGCSGFRIDMAVKHPTQNGKFAIGIECDGASYHSSRTARERDRLRQTVLEDMGWTIYRIWSTDWIKDQKTEEQKLIRAIEEAIGHKTPEKENKEFIDEIDDNINLDIEIEEKVETSDNLKNKYNFEPYRKYQQDDMNEYDELRDTADIILDIISLEQPIHFEELCRRVAPAYDRQKATSVVKISVLDILKNQLKDKISENNYFLRLIGFNDITVRVQKSENDYLRPITYICDEELALAMKTIAQHSFGITPDALFIETAREFGYKRTGEHIISSLRNVYNNMLSNNEVTEIDGKVNVL